MPRIILDTDPGIDDATAILLACASSETAVEALTTVGGNVGIEHTTRNALRILDLAGRDDIPVHRGSDRSLTRDLPRSSAAHGEDGLGGTLDVEPSRGPESLGAVEFLVEHVRAHPGEITLVPIGPLTNIAEAVRADRGFATDVKDVVLMGGAEGTGNITPSAEFNFWYDPDAADVVFCAGFRSITMVGLDATRQAFMSPGTRELVRQIGGPIGRFVHRATRTYTDHYWRAYREVGSELCDVLTIARLLDPTLVESVPAEVTVATDGICEGRSVVARAQRYREGIPNAQVATTVATERLFALLLTTLFPDYSEVIARVLAHEYR